MLAQTFLSFSYFKAAVFHFFKIFKERALTLFVHFWTSYSLFNPLQSGFSLASVLSTQLRVLLWWRSPRSSQFPNLMNITSFDTIESLFHSFLCFLILILTFFLWAYFSLLTFFIFVVLQNSLDPLLFSLQKFTYSYGINDLVPVDS